MSPVLQPAKVFDALVLGAGPAGAAASIALANQGLSVNWLASRKAHGTTFGEHLAPRASVPLERLGVFGIFNDPAHQRVPGIVSNWGGSVPVQQDYIFNLHGYGWNLDRRELGRTLNEAATVRGVNTGRIRRLFSIRRCSEIWEIAFASDAGACEVRARVLIDATGRNAHLARRLGPRPERLDRLVALIGTLVPCKDAGNLSDNRLMIEPMSDGWWYSLVLGDRRVIAVCMTDADLITTPGLGGAARHWKRRLADSEFTRRRIENVTQPTSFAMTPAYSQCLARPGGDGWIAIGDASMALDPLSGSGITKALQDGLAAADVVQDALEGYHDSLEAYIANQKNAFAEYCEQYSAYYSEEGRWPNSPFWNRRQVIGGTWSSSFRIPVTPTPEYDLV